MEEKLRKGSIAPLQEGDKELKRNVKESFAVRLGPPCGVIVRHPFPVIVRSTATKQSRRRVGMRASATLRMTS